MKAVCMVAHPDDCVIFAYSLMHHFDRLSWHVGYLTYQHTDPRAQELDRFWTRRGVTTSFLGFVDDYHDVELGRPSFDTDAACHAIQDITRDADVIVTHDADGDYGHPHHKFVHGCVRGLCHDHVITFAPPGQGTHHYKIDHLDYDQTELPLHWSVIQGFHPATHRNSYIIKSTTYHRISHA